MITVSTIIDQTRDILNDTTAGSYRWSDALLISYVDLGVVDIRNRRPDTRLDEYGDILDYTAVDELADTIDLEDKWIEPLVNYTCRKAFELDADATGNMNRVQYHTSLYEAGLMK